MTTAYYTKPRQGIVQGIVQSQKQGINYFNNYTPTPPATIYDQTSSAAVDSFIRNLLGAGSVDDYDTTAVWPMDDFHTAGGGMWVNSDDNNTLLPQGAANDTSSPHGRAIVSSGVDYWKTATADDFVVNTGAFAFAVRLKVTGTLPVLNSYIVLSQGDAQNYLGIGVNASGAATCVIKKSGGGNTTATATGVVISDGNYHWVLGGRSAVNNKLWATVAGADGSSVYSNTNDIVNSAVPMGTYDPVVGSCLIDNTIDHVIIWKGTPAENVYTNRLSLLFEDL